MGKFLPFQCALGGALAGGLITFGVMRYQEHRHYAPFVIPNTSAPVPEEERRHIERSEVPHNVGAADPGHEQKTLIPVKVSLDKTNYKAGDKMKIAVASVPQASYLNIERVQVQLFIAPPPIKPNLKLKVGEIPPPTVVPPTVTIGSATLSLNCDTRRYEGEFNVPAAVPPGDLKLLVNVEDKMHNMQSFSRPPVVPELHFSGVAVVTDKPEVMEVSAKWLEQAVVKMYTTVKFPKGVRMRQVVATLGDSGLILGGGTLACEQKEQLATCDATVYLRQDNKTRHPQVEILVIDQLGNRVVKHTEL